MKYCAKCGKEVADGAFACPRCGSSVDYTSSQPSMVLDEGVSKSHKSRSLWVVLSVVVLAVCIVAAILFMPRDLKMKDFKEVNVVSAIIRYGYPEAIRTDEDGYTYLTYGDKVDFYGITPYAFTVYPEENTVAFFFKDEDGYDVYRKIDRFCELKDVGLGIFHTFSYGDIEITTYDYDGSYVHIELN